MKKLILTLILVFSFTMKCFAVENIQIDNVDKKTVMDYIVTLLTESEQNFMLDSVSEYGISLIGSKPLNNMFGSQVATQQNKINFTAVQKGEDVLLTVNEVATIYHNNGRMEVHPVNDVMLQKALLTKIKRYFNDYYLFGFTPTNKKKNGGYVLDKIYLGGALKENGINKGDILIAINGRKVIKNKDLYLSGNMIDNFNPNSVKFLIKQNGVLKEFIVTPKLTRAEYIREQ